MGEGRDIKQGRRLKFRFFSYRGLSPFGSIVLGMLIYLLFSSLGGKGGDAAGIVMGGIFGVLLFIPSLFHIRHDYLVLNHGKPFAAYSNYLFGGSPSRQDRLERLALFGSVISFSFMLNGQECSGCYGPTNPLGAKSYGDEFTVYYSERYGAAILEEAAFRIVEVK